MLGKAELGFPGGDRNGLEPSRYCARKAICGHRVEVVLYLMNSLSEALWRVPRKHWNRPLRQDPTPIILLVYEVDRNPRKADPGL